MEAPFQISREAFNAALPRVALESPRAAQSSCRFDCAPSERRHVARRRIPRGLFNASTGERAIASTDGKKLIQHSTSAQELNAAFLVQRSTSTKDDEETPLDRDPTRQFGTTGTVKVSDSTDLTKTTQLPTCSMEPTGQKLGGDNGYGRADGDHGHAPGLGRSPVSQSKE